MSQQTKTKELLVLFLKKCFCQTKWAEISAQLLCTAILYTHKKTGNIDSLKVRGRESKSPMTVYRYIVSSTTHGIPFSPEDQPMMKFTTGLMCGFIVSSLLLAMSIPAIPPTLEKKGACCFCMEQSIGNTEVCEAKKTISYVLSRVRLVVSYDCGWLGLMARCDQETSEDASSGLRRRSSAALRTCGIGGEEVWTSCQRTAAKSLEINILWGFMRLCQTWMGDLTSDWFTLRITCHLGNLVWDQWVQEFVYQYQYLLQFVLCFQTTVVSSGGLCFLVFLVLQNHPCPFSRNHINVWRNLCGWVSVSQSMKLPCPVGWTYCIAEKKIHWDATLRSMLPRGKSHGQPYWPLEHLTSRQKTPEQSNQETYMAKTWWNLWDVRSWCLRTLTGAIVGLSFQATCVTEVEAATKVISLYQPK